MPTPLQIFSPNSQVLRLGGPAPGQPDPIAELLAASGLSILPLTEEPPARPDAFRRLASQARFALIDLDQDKIALPWLKAFRERRPVPPLIAFYATAELPALLAAGSIGLDGAIKLPASAEKITAVLAPWLPAPIAASTPRPPDDSGNSMFFAPRERPLTATHLSAASDGNQALLRTIDKHPQETRFLATGPVGAEFALLVQELAARRKIPYVDIALPGLPPPPRIGLLVTGNRALFTRSTAPLALLLLPGTGPNETAPTTEEFLRLPLKPLRCRLPDIAHYLCRWLPEIFAANNRKDPPFPLSPAWRHAFLAHPWPGEFSELIRSMHRLALLPAGEPPLPGFLAPVPADAGFDSVASSQIPRSYRDRLSRRIPANLLPSVLAALGCPELPPGHE